MPETTQNPMERAAALVARLRASFGLSDGIEGKEAEQIKYVIYARRSLEESSVKQERSIGDQIGECKTLADRLGRTPEEREEILRMLDFERHRLGDRRMSAVLAACRLQIPVIKAPEGLEP